MLTRRFALIIGIIYVLVGLLGFVPMLSQAALDKGPRLAVPNGYGYLLGLFPINLLHNLLHLGIGVLGIACSRTFSSARTFARSLAIVYAILAIMGLIPGLNTFFGLMPIFGNDVWLHALTALVAAYFGFAAQDQPPRKRQIIPIAPSDLARLAEVLRQYGLSTADVNTNKTVTFALPTIIAPAGQQKAILLKAAPLKNISVETTQELYSSEQGVIIGVLQAGRDMPLADTTLPVDIYLVKFLQRQVHFINGAGTEPIPPVRATMRNLKYDVVPPQTTLTRESIWYSWHYVEIRSEPAPKNAISADEGSKMLDQMRKSTDVVQKLLKEGEAVNIAASLPGVEGQSAVQLRQANLLAAPTAARVRQAKLLDAPIADEAQQIDGMLLGVFEVLLTIDVPGFPEIPPGSYVVRATQMGDDWKMRFERTDGLNIEVPAHLSEEGQFDDLESGEPFISLSSVCVWLPTLEGWKEMCWRTDP